jgi:dihydrofolate synthase/folylpolyglutamate synthase
MVDGAHNVYSMESLLKSLPEYLNYDKLIVVVGFSKDKNIEGMAQALDDKADSIVATVSRHPRSLPVDELVGLFKQSAQKASTVAIALRMALESAGENDLVLATGSLFLTAEVRESALGIEPELYPGLPKPGSKS